MELVINFVSGDGRTLKLERYTQYTNLRLPDAMVKKIPFNDMQNKIIESSRNGFSSVVL